MTGQKPREPAFRDLSPAMEDYLKAIYALSSEHDTVTTQVLADWQGVAPASVTSMLKRLADHKLVDYTPYRGVALTESGRRVAIEMVRHHRLLELYLTQALGYAWDEVHAEAERLEHFISEKLEARIDAALGYPKVDPHGSPIPALDGTVVEQPGLAPLSEHSGGGRLRVVRVSEVEPATLRRFAEVGLWPGVTLEVLGPGRVLVGSREQELEARLWPLIRVAPAPRGAAACMAVAQMEPRQSGTIYRLRAGGERLRRLRSLGLEKGRRLQAGSERGTFQLGEGRLSLSQEEARSVLVELD